MRSNLKTNKIAIFTVAIILSLLGLQAANAELKDMQIVLGDTQTINTDYKIGDVAVGNESIVQFIVRDNRTEIYINPIKQGDTKLTIWDTNSEKRDEIVINVVSINIDKTLLDVENFISDIPGVSAMVEGQTIKIVGEVHSPTHLRSIQLFTAKNPKVISQVILSNKAMSVIARRIEEAVNTPGITVRAVRGKLVMEGLTYSKDIYNRIDKIARLYDNNIINLVEMRTSNRRPGHDKTIKLDVYFMEIKNSAVRNFGIQWAPGSTVQTPSNQDSGGGGGGFIGIANGINSLVGFVFNLLPKIKWVHTTGRGRVLERPSFIVKSGESVDFYSGTEVPYYSDMKVEFKEVGVRVHAEPIAYQDDVDLKVKVDFSSLSSMSDRGIDHNNLDTTVYVKANQAVVLGGMIRSGDVKAYNKIPKDINTSSALFTLFLSKDFQANESQFYIFIVPQILNTPHGAEMKLKRWLELHEDLEKERKFIK